VALQAESSGHGFSTGKTSVFRKRIYATSKRNRPGRRDFQTIQLQTSMEFLKACLKPARFIRHLGTGRSQVMVLPMVEQMHFIQ